MAVFFYLSLCGINAEARNTIRGIDYSTLSVQEIQKEINLLYQYAKRAFAEDDIELSKFLFYQILEFDPEHPGVNKYLDFIIPKRIYRMKLREQKKQKLVSGVSGKEITLEQEERLRELEKEVIVSEKHKEVKDKFYKKVSKRLPKEERRKQKLEFAQKKRYEAEKRKQEAIQKKEQVRLEREKKKAEKREAQRIKREQAKQEGIRQKELKKIVQEEKEKRKLELVQRKKQEAAKKSQEEKLARKQARLEKEKKKAEKREAQRIKREQAKQEGIRQKELKKIVQEEKRAKRTRAKIAEAKIADKDKESRPVIAIEKEKLSGEKTQEGIKAQEEFISKIVKRELGVIRDGQKRLAKEEEVRRKARNKQNKKKEAELRRQGGVVGGEFLPLAKLSRKTKKQQAIPKPRTIKRRIGDDEGAKKEEDLEKYLLEQRKIVESKLKDKEIITEESKEAVQEEVEETIQLIERFRKEDKEEEFVARLLGKAEDISQKDHWDKVKALYEEGIYNYRAGEYDSAQESFSEILE